VQCQQSQQPHCGVPGGRRCCCQVAAPDVDGELTELGRP
jgi:hypothetical protein